MNKPLFADLIAQHPGLAEELKAIGDGFDLGFQAGVKAAIDLAWVGLDDEDIFKHCPAWLSRDQCKAWVQQIEAELKKKNTQP